MSHEIRTPLNAIEGFSRIMAETDSPEERMNYLEIIESNNSRLLSLINEILDLSRVEAGEISIKKTPTDLKKLCTDIKQIFKFRCPPTVELTWTEPDMPITMNTDENRLTQVFTNLISNALKHTMRGSIRYGYRIIDEGLNIEFYVSDTGSGIAPEFIDQIFETYTSKDAEQQQGFGLGLALCRIIVEKMGGTIKVESELGKGSTFTFTMPFHGTIGGMATSNRTTTSVRTLRVSTRPDEINQKTILVAEDEESNFELVRIVLQKRYRLLRAHNGIEAVTINEDEHPDLILMDIRMPEMNGLDATRIIKEVNHSTPVIALSAYAFEENILEAKAAGCDEFMAKPFKVEDLIEICAKYIDK
jgi:CheY-like chemotaxis protein/anti-sigma regulatory factor (Ser/Thr protein kinase)